MYSTNLLVRCPANVLAPKEKWSDEKCKELASYINDRKDSLNSLVGSARSYGEENWDSIRRGAADGLEISAFLGSGELIPLDIDTWATIGGVGAAVTSGMTDFISMYTRIYDPTTSSGRLNNAVLGTGKALRVGGQLAAGAGLVARSDMAREAYQRGDYLVGLHYSATGILTGVGTSKTLSGTPIGRGITWGSAIGSGLEGWLWGLGDQYVTDHMELLNTRFNQNLDYLSTAQSQYKDHCE